MIILCVLQTVHLHNCCLSSVHWMLRMSYWSKRLWSVSWKVFCFLSYDWCPCFSPQSLDLSLSASPLAQSPGRTVVVIAHRLSTIQNANAVAVLDQQRVAECGQHAELLSNRQGLFRKLMEKQAFLQEEQKQAFRWLNSNHRRTGWRKKKRVAWSESGNTERALDEGLGTDE